MWIIIEVCLNPKSLLELQKRLFGETWCKHVLMVLWYGRSCEEMRGKIVRTCEQNDTITTQSRNSMLRRPPIQGRRNGICWRIVKGLLTYCSRMSIISTHWWALLYTERTGARGTRSAHWIWYIHHTGEFKQHCHVGNTAQQCRLGLFQDSVSARFLKRLKNSHKVKLCAFSEVTRSCQ